MSAPRVNGRMLSTWRGKQVLVIGRVLSSNDSLTQIECSDHQTVRVFVQRGQQALPQGQIVEFVGQVNEDCSVGEMNRLVLSDNFDLDLYDQAVTLTQNQEVRNFFYAA